MKTVTLSIGSVQDTVLPEGKTFSGFKFTLAAPGADPASVVTTETSVSFSDAAPGTYLASVAAVDQDGNVLGAESTVEVVVPEDPKFPQPLALTASVA